MKISNSNNTKEDDIISEYREYFNKIKFHLQDGDQLRSGFIDEELSYNNGKNLYRCVTEVKEIRRTMNNKSYIEVISSSFPNCASKDGNDTDTLNGLKKYYDGWYDSDKIEWLEQVNGREDILNMLLKEIDDKDGK